MKNLKRCVVLISMLTSILFVITTASAESSEIVDSNTTSESYVFVNTEDIASRSKDIETRSNTDAYLDTVEWTILKQSTTVLPYSPVIINQSYNRGVIWVKVEDKDGNIIGNPKLISPGDSATMDMINAFTGYTISAKAYTVPGSYMITIH